MVKQNIHCQAHVICINTVYALCAVLPCEKKNRNVLQFGQQATLFLLYRFYNRDWVPVCYAPAHKVIRPSNPDVTNA